MIPLLLAAIVELRLDYTRVSLTKTVRHYTQLVDGIEVAGGERIEENGRVVFDRLGVAPAILPARLSVGSDRHVVELRPRHTVHVAPFLGLDAIAARLLGAIERLVRVDDQLLRRACLRPRGR